MPLRFLLADDPGAGKTIMSGLYIKELLLRGDLARCLIVAPGGLVEQWQGELHDKFGLRFAILTRDLLTATAHGFADAAPDRRCGRELPGHGCLRRTWNHGCRSTGSAGSAPSVTSSREV